MKQAGIRAMFALAGLAAACSEQTGAVTPADPIPEAARMASTEDQAQPRRQLPYAHGRSFATLDDYLAHLRQYAGPVGQPWYREIRPGTYELVTTRVPPGRHSFSRAKS